MARGFFSTQETTLKENPPTASMRNGLHYARRPFSFLSLPGFQDHFPGVDEPSPRVRRDLTGLKRILRRFCASSASTCRCHGEYGLGSSFFANCQVFRPKDIHLLQLNQVIRMGLYCSWSLAGFSPGFCVFERQQTGDPPWISSSRYQTLRRL